MPDKNEQIAVVIMRQIAYLVEPMLVESLLPHWAKENQRFSSFV